jgi:parallel beta-helix repeat protein
MRTLPARAAILAIAIGSLLAVAGPAAAATLTVCPPPGVCSEHTIQDAVDVANPGDTLDVSAGATPFAGATIDKPLNIEGNRHDVDGRDPLRGVSESIINGNLLILANDVIVDGFMFNSGQPAVEIRPQYSGYQIINNVFQENTFGIYPHSSGDAPSLIRRNRFIENNSAPPLSAAGNAIYADQGTRNLRIDENLFEGNLNTGVLITHTQPGVPNEDITITDNVAQPSSDGTSLPNGLLAYIRRSKDVTIENNVTEDSFSHGIDIEASRNVDILGNTITGVKDGWSGIRLSTNDFGNVPNQNVSIVGNTIMDNVLGPWLPTYGIKMSDGASLGAVEVHFNRIVGNGVSILNLDGDDEIDASNNWFGCNAGPDAIPGPDDPDCDSVEGNVDTAPWLQLGLSASRESILTGGEDSNIVARLTNSNGDELDTPPFPDVTVDFLTTLGTLGSGTEPLSSGGSAASLLTSGLAVGLADVSATLDNETVTVPVEIADPPPPPPPGPTGPTGAQGPAGPQGPAGADAPAPPLVVADPVEDTRVRGFFLGAPSAIPITRGFVFVDVRSEEDVRYVVKTTVAVPFTAARTSAAARRFKLATKRTSFVDEGVQRRISIRLPFRVQEAVRDGLAQGRRSSARLVVTATDRAGNSQVNKQTIRLR